MFGNDGIFSQGADRAELIDQRALWGTLSAPAAIDFTASHQVGDTVVVIGFSDSATEPSMVQRGWTLEASTSDIAIWSRVLASGEDPADFDFRCSDFPGNALGAAYLLRNVSNIDAAVNSAFASSVTASLSATSTGGVCMGAGVRQGTTAVPTMTTGYSDFTQTPTNTPFLGLRGGSETETSAWTPSVTASDFGTVSLDVGIVAAT